jgi:hypothetical protein
MNDREKKQLLALGGAAVLLALWRALPRGRVTDVDTVNTTFTPTTFAPATEAAIDRYNLALLHIRNVMGADPNTLATKNPAPSDRTYIEETLALGSQLAASTGGAVTDPELERQRYAFAQTLPGDALAAVNRELYELLGVDPAGDNAATRGLTLESEQRARTLIGRWRAYSQEAVNLLFYLLDEARELGGVT